MITSGGEKVKKRSLRCCCLPYIAIIIPQRKARSRMVSVTLTF